MSKTIQLLLQAAMENPPDRDQSKYGVMTYTLLKEAILSLVENADELVHRADQQAIVSSQRLCLTQDNLNVE